jgi:hypothetical protein
MKSKLIIVALVGTALLFAYPTASYAWSKSRGGHYYSAPRATYNHHYHHRAHRSSDPVPYILGGLVVGGILGAVLSQPGYAAPPPAPGRTYAYPEPSYGVEEPPGEWVSVPGRWMDGTWVPAHRAWVPVNPY